MKKRIENWLEDFDSPNSEPASYSKMDDVIGGALQWSVRNLLPILLLALALNLLILFTLPMEMTMLKWFWLKDPLSITVAFILFRFCRKCVRKK